MNIFEIIGPIMIGPSSSHTAGAVRMGRVAWKILGEKAIKADIGLVGSFAMTYKGHGTDKALIAGILGMKPDDARIPKSLDIAKEMGLQYEFSQAKIPNAHPNTAMIELTGEKGARCDVEGVSVGGGNILITKLNGMKSTFTGSAPTLVIAHQDRSGVVAAVTGMLSHFGINIGSLRLSRIQKNKPAIMTIELDTNIEKPVVQVLRQIKDVVSVIYMQPGS
ncbi:MAG: L-serine ammonia-lyase, iron-sulfur-dependent subunit beta [Defluviitaleaceae bacterium]|nr:L-serine ammonia-lyase, iron-sulfur-dependent subunit beta [Defluviitaleaceae bacterium]